MGSVPELLGRVVGAGVAPGISAGWGRGVQEPQVAVAGDAAVRPLREPAREDSWWDLASLTKPLVVTTLFMLASRHGDLTPTTTVGEVLAEGRGQALDRVSFEQLLAHTSGLPGWHPLYAVADGPGDVVRRILAIRPDRPPGTVVEYSCLGFVLLGAALERVLGESIDLAFEQLVLRPLGLERELGFRPDSDRHVPAAGATTATVERRLTGELGYDPDTVPATARHLPDDGNSRFLGGVSGNAGLFGTVGGVYRLGREFLVGSGSLLHPDEILRSTTSVTAGLEQERGLGWQLAPSPGCSAGSGLGPRAFGHTGFTGSSLWVDPGREAVLVLLTNRNHPGQREQDLHPLRRRFHTLAIRELGG